MPVSKQTTNRRARATAWVSFYDGESHEPTSSTVRSEVRSAPGGGRLFPRAFRRGRHRPHLVDRSPGGRGVLARERGALRVPAALSTALLPRVVRARLRVGAVRAYGIRAAGSFQPRGPVVPRQVRNGGAGRVSHAPGCPWPHLLRALVARALVRGGGIAL